MKLLQIEASDLANKFAKASIEGRGTPQEIADRREAAVHLLIAKYFPFPFRVTKGNIIDAFGGRSASIDCVVLNPEHPHTVSDGNHFSVLLADGTDFAIEVKPDLVSKSEIVRALNQIASVKRLVRCKKDLRRLDRDSKINGVILSNTSYSDINLLLMTIAQHYFDEKIKREHQFDLLIINNRCLILNIRNGFSLYPKDGKSEGLLVLESGINTFAAALLFMNRLPLSSMRMTDSVIANYIIESELGPATMCPVANHILSRVEAM
jgi:hypothetical protein